jgi:ribosomal protein S18 acetylase RimI-like enzyme
MTIEIVRITEAHAAGFHACLDTVAREKRYLAQTTAPPLESMQSFVRDSVRNNVAQYVALDGDTLVGWCDVFGDCATAVAHCGTLGMGVLADYRGRGIGTRLINATLAHAQRQGLVRVELEVRIDNTTAIRLYERVGFAPEGRKRKRLRFDGAYFDALAMGLLFDEVAAE